MYAFRRGREDIHQYHTAIIAVEQSVRRLVKDAVDGTHCLPDVWRGFFMLEEITSDHYNNMAVLKMFSLLLIQMLPLLWNGPSIRNS